MKTYLFTVASTDHPMALNLDLAPDGANPCNFADPHSWEPSDSPEQVRLPLEGLPMRNNLVVVNQHSVPVRFGQLAIAVTAVATTNELGDSQFGKGPSHGHYFVLVALGIKNVSSDPNCTDFTAGLLTDSGYKAQDTWREWTSKPRTYELMPGESSGGTLSFEVYQDSRPVGLALKRSILAEKYCAQKLSRPVDMHGGSTVRIQITNVPGIRLAGHS